MAIPTSSAITKDNLFTQVHANIFNLINNRSNVSDPNDSTGNRKFVYTREPNLSGRFAGFPFIIVPYSEYSQNDKVADASKANTMDTFEIVVMTSDSSTSDSDGNPLGAQQLADISTDIVKTLNNRTNSQTLRNNGLRNKTFPSVAFEWGELNGKPIFRREFNLKFEGWRTIA